MFEVEARRLGSAIDPVLRIVDAAGKQIARSDDAPALGVDSRLDVTFPRDGDYYAVVHDARFSQQSQNFYRLKVGNFAYADGIFPLGWKRGEKVDVELFGGSFSVPVKTAADLSASESQAGVHAHQRSRRLRQSAVSVCRGRSAGKARTGARGE